METGSDDFKDVFKLRSPAPPTDSSEMSASCLRSSMGTNAEDSLTSRLYNGALLEDVEVNTDCLLPTLTLRQTRAVCQRALAKISKKIDKSCSTYVKIVSFLDRIGKASKTHELQDSSISSERSLRYLLTTSNIGEMFIFPFDITIEAFNLQETRMDCRILSIRSISASRESP